MFPRQIAPPDYHYETILQYLLPLHFLPTNLIIRPEVSKRPGKHLLSSADTILETATNRWQLIARLGQPYEEYSTLENNPFRVLLSGVVDADIAEQCTCLMFKSSDMIYLVFVDSNAAVRASMVTNN